MLKKKSPLLLFSFIFIVIWTNSLIGTTNIKNWLIENTLTVISLCFLVFTYKKYHFSNLSYFLICVFLCIHVYGSKHTYAENPLGFWFQDVFNFSRNHYDRLVHFGFGFLLFYPLWEYFSKWLNYPKNIALCLPIMTIISLSCVYEIVEWLVADVFFKEQGASYLGTQGDIWDAQKDAALASIGVVISGILFYFLFKITKLRKFE
jgi:putative membrane protein